MRVVHLFCGGRNRVEADVGEEHRCRCADRTDSASQVSEKSGKELRVELSDVPTLQRQGDEGSERRNCGCHQDGIDPGALSRPHHQEAFDNQCDRPRRQVDEAPSAPPGTTAPALSQGGNDTPRNASRNVPDLDRPTDTAAAAIAHSMTTTHHMVQAKNSPIVAQVIRAAPDLSERKINCL